MESAVIRPSDGVAAGLVEKRKLGNIQSRFISLDTLKTTLTINIVTSLMDSIMSVGQMTLEVFVTFNTWR